MCMSQPLHFGLLSVYSLCMRERETAESCTIATLSVSIHPLRLLSMILSLYLWIALHFKDIYSDAHKWT